METQLENAPFINGIHIYAHHKETFEQVESFDLQASSNKFNSFIINTCAKLARIIWRSQYYAYCNKFGVKSSLNPDSERIVNGIVGRKMATETVTIRITFIDLKIIIYVKFPVLNE